MIFAVEPVEFEGERLKGSHNAASADWFTIDPRGVGHARCSATMETHDDVTIFTSDRGHVSVAAGGAVHSAPVYDTGDERYRLLNSIDAVTKGTLDGGRLSYEIYEVR